MHTATALEGPATHMAVGYGAFDNLSHRRDKKQQHDIISPAEVGGRVPRPNCGGRVWRHQNRAHQWRGGARLGLHAVMPGWRGVGGGFAESVAEYFPSCSSIDVYGG